MASRIKFKQGGVGINFTIVIIIGHEEGMIHFQLQAYNFKNY